MRAAHQGVWYGVEVFFYSRPLRRVFGTHALMQAFV